MAWRVSSQNSEALLPIPAYMEMYFAVIEGTALIGGDSAIDALQEEKGLYATGEGSFDFEKRAGKIIGSRATKNNVGNLRRVLPEGSLGYGGVGALCRRCDALQRVAVWSCVHDLRSSRYNRRRVYRHDADDGRPNDSRRRGAYRCVSAAVRVVVSRAGPP